MTAPAPVVCETEKYRPEGCRWANSPECEAVFIKNTKHLTDEEDDALKKLFNVDGLICFISQLELKERVKS